MDDEVTDGVSRFLDSLQSDFPTVVEALSNAPNINDLDRVRAALATVDREHLEFLSAFSLTFLAQAWNLTALILERRSETQDLRKEGERLQRQIWGRMKYTRDPEQAAIQSAKAEAFELWTEYRAGKYWNRGLRENSDFSRECVKRWPVLKQSTIERKWIPQWEKEARAHPAS